MKRLLLACSVVLLSASHLLAQQFTTLSQYMLNKIYLNPAWSGDGEQYQLNALYRTQWSGYKDYEGKSVAPQLQLFNGLANIGNTPHTVGLQMGRDKAGVQNDYQIQLSYAYRILFARSNALSFGVRTGIFSRSIDFSKHVLENYDDPSIPLEKQTEVHPDATLGVWFETENYYAGFSAKGVLTEGLYTSPGFRNPGAYILTAGYHLPVSDELKITPSFQAITSQGDFTFDASVLANYGNALFSGLSYRHQKAASVIAGIALLDKALRLSYAFDYTTVNRSVTSAASHEIMLTYKAGKRKQRGQASYLQKSTVKQPTRVVTIVKDKDKDGVPDDKDKCIDVPGFKRFQGCPDTDADGIPDNEDECPNVPGAKSLQGCPDTDNDGVKDTEDECPDVPGKKEDKGCPVQLTPQTLAHITFETGKATLQPSSYAYLDEILDVLNEYDQTRVIVEGHTDSEGEGEHNMQLSEERAQTIKTYLVEKGLSEERISIIGYGETKPVDTNDTAEGRSKNRRVEIHFVKEGNN